MVCLYDWNLFDNFGNLFGAYILSVRTGSVLSSTSSAKWESMSVQSCNCRTVVDISQVVRLVRIW